MVEVILKRLDGNEIGRGETVRAIVEANRSNLRSADLCGADLHGAHLRGADLHGADLSGAYLHGAYLRGANLAGAYLRGAYLRGADLSGADLSGANLAGAYLSGTYLRGANLRGAKNVITSHDVAAEILLRSAKTEELERWAMWPSAHRDECWDKWLRRWKDAPPKIRAWVKKTLCADPDWGYREKFEVKRG